MFAEHIPLTLSALLPLAAKPAAALLELRSDDVLWLAGAPGTAMVLVGEAFLFRCQVRTRTVEGEQRKVLTGWEVMESLSEAKPLWSRDLERAIDTRVKVELMALLGSTRITLRELRSLTPETEVVLDQEVSTPIILLANGAAVAEGKVVAVGERVGVRITRLLGEQDPGGAE